MTDIELRNMQDRIDDLNRSVNLCLDKEEMSDDVLELFYFVLNVSKDAQLLLSTVRMLQRKLIINSK